MLKTINDRNSRIMAPILDFFLPFIHSFFLFTSRSNVFLTGFNKLGEANKKQVNKKK